jgi:hypothetical protein
MGHAPKESDVNQPQGGDRRLIASIQRLERAARSQLDRLYEGTRRVGGGTLAAVDHRAVDRVRELMVQTRAASPDRRRPSPR